LEGFSAEEKVPELTEAERQKMAAKIDKDRKVIAYLRSTEAYETDYMQAIRGL
jgi:hypothetical protein